MKKSFAVLVLAIQSVFNFLPSIAHAQGTAFTYQGRLASGGSAANGTYDLTFALYDSTNSPGILFAGPVTNAAVAVAGGLFTVALDFGNQFDGSPRWLQISVRTNGAAGFTPLNPRQPLTPSPYAILAQSATGIPGLSIQQNSSDAPNIIAGSPVNYISNGVVGATIAGGGTTNYFGATYSNSVSVDFGVVSGGYLNTISGPGAGGTIGGGFLNKAVGSFYGYSTIGGGYNNIASNDFSTVSGGYQNFVFGGSGVISGGSFNRVTGSSGTVAGGYINAAGGPYATVSGGSTNSAAGDVSTIGGGSMILLSPGVSSYGTIGGGLNNTINTAFSTIGGGDANSINGTGSGETIAGGFLNKTFGSFYGYSTVGGGYNNIASNDYATVSGGYQNYVFGGAGVIGGGNFNRVTGGSATVAGGYINSAAGDYSAVIGGSQNSATGVQATVAGGLLNTASGSNSFAAGHQAQALHNGTFVWADTTSGNFSSTGSNQFLIRAGGGVGIGTPSPGAALDVRGDIHLGPSGQFNAPAGEERLRIIRGVINAVGVPIVGSGFTVTHPATGQFTVNFTTSFSGAPAVTATADSGGGATRMIMTDGV